ncbi:hypothetical protein niasHT_027775 [Heterodera trifolii]|uniref:Uncharacterized protein n=1 Tax=Heterodera trifolii TaxID=157864 RepID=A0ABD2KIS7_9BILA
MGKVVSVFEKVAEFVVEAAQYAADFLLGDFSKVRGVFAVGSFADYENPQITHMLNLRKCLFLRDSFTSVLRSKARKLSNYGLDHIAYAFVRGVRVDMYCSNCGRRLIN